MKQVDCQNSNDDDDNAVEPVMMADRFNDDNGNDDDGNDDAGYPIGTVGRFDNDDNGGSPKLGQPRFQLRYWCQRIRRRYRVSPFLVL